MSDDLARSLPKLMISQQQAEKLVCREAIRYLLFDDHRAALPAAEDTNAGGFDYSLDVDENFEAMDTWSDLDSDSSSEDSSGSEAEDGYVPSERDSEEHDTGQGAWDRCMESFKGPLAYSVQYWVDHLKQITEFDPTIFELCKKFLSDQAYRGNYLNFIWLRRFRPPFIKCMPSWNPLFYPLYYDVPWLVEALLEADPTLVNQKSGKYGTPLIMATHHNPSQIPMLLKFHPNVDGNTSGFQLNALQHAIFTGNLAAVDALLGVANLDVQFSFGCRGYGFTRVTALHIAARQARSMFVAKMFAAGANLEIRDDKGQTAIFRAISSDDLLTVKMLVGAGCDLGARDFLGKTVLQHAVELQNASITGFLLTSMRSKEATLSPSFEVLALEWAEDEIWYDTVKDIISDSAMGSAIEPRRLPWSSSHLNVLGMIHRYIPPFLSNILKHPGCGDRQERIMREREEFVIIADTDPEEAYMVLAISGRVRSGYFRIQSADQGEYLCDAAEGVAFIKQ